VKIPPNRPVQRRTLPAQVHATEAEKWRAVARSVQEHHLRGQPVLVGTPSVAASEAASRVLAGLGLEHVVLNAKQDKEEAAIVARAGEPGRITVATNMAGRGTDIKLAPGVAEAGGLHVILCERHDSARVDRQLEGRCGRQGDPGTFVSILSLEDHLPTVYGGLLYRAFAAWAKRAGEGARRRLGAGAIRLTQKRVERSHSRERRGLLKSDRQTVRMLSFSGRSE
jgi:preprotein translocase subunit SecA